MSVRKLTTKLTMLLILVAGSVNASAKEHEPLLVDPFAFDPDFHWFEPIYDADILDMKPKKRAHTGWFATYDRISLYGSRPSSNDDLGDENKFDSGGGHRYDVGFMRPDEDTGFLFTYLENKAVAGDTVRVDRLNRLNEDDLNGDTLYALGPNRFGLPVFPEDGNVIGFSRRFYDVGLTLNAMDMKSYELSKTWRMEPYHYGGILEPMLGLRFIRAEDGAALRTYSRTAEDVDQAAIGLGASPYVLQLPNSDLPLERYQEDVATVDNQMYTIQAGLRYFKFQDRFRYSAEFRGFTGFNLQCFETNRSTTTTVYDSFDIGSAVVSNINVRNALQYQTNEEFLIGFDARAELGYQLTKMINVRCGVQLIDLTTGVWRSSRNLQDLNNGNRLTPALDSGKQDQSYVAVGYTFGIELNR